ELKPRNPRWDIDVRASFARQAVMTTLGAQMTDVAPGRVRIEMPFDAAFTQQHGFLHAGIVTAGLDSACGFAAMSLMAPGAAVLTAEFKTSLLAPARGARFAFDAEVIKSGRTLSFAEAKGYALDGGTARLIATLSATLMAVEGRADVQG
ncbi:MAG: PaaI family thioesterase, partial [Pseudomonadota bacterium]